MNLHLDFSEIGIDMFSSIEYLIIVSTEKFSEINYYNLNNFWFLTCKYNIIEYLLKAP